MKKQHPTAHWRDLITQSRQFSEISEGQNLSLTLKARGALLDIMKSLSAESGDIILIPAFHCPTVVQPALLAGYKVKFFNINRDLSIDYEDLKRLLSEKVAALVVINYFGFEWDVECLRDDCVKNKVLIIEDCSHSMMRKNPIELSGGRGDVAVFSFYKNIASAVGGGYRINGNGFEVAAKPRHILSMKKSLTITKEILEQVISNLSHRNLVRRLYFFLESLRHGPKIKTKVLPISQSSKPLKQEYPLEPDFFNCNIPRMSAAIIKNAKLDSIQAKVVGNFKNITKKIKEIKQVKPLFLNLPTRTFPWCFPVLINDRHLYDVKIKEMGGIFFTFGETLHDEVYTSDCISSKALENAKFLSNSMICFSIHQDINEEDIEHTCRILTKLFGRV